MILYTHIDHLPLPVFLACLLRQGYGQLVTEGAAAEDPAALQEAWSNLYTQYLELTGSEASEYILFLQRDMVLLRWKIAVTEGGVQLLRLTHNDGVAQALATLGHDTTELTDGNPRYARALALIEAQLPSMRLRLSGMEEELGQAESDQQPEAGEPLSEGTFRGWCVRLSRFMGYRVALEGTMTGEYARMVHEYISHYKAKAEAYGSQSQG